MKRIIEIELSENVMEALTEYADAATTNDKAYLPEEIVATIVENAMVHFRAGKLAGLIAK